MCRWMEISSILQAKPTAEPKWNRPRLFIPKTDALDAVSVGSMDMVSEIAGS
jgi:hypothetical protein